MTYEEARTLLVERGALALRARIRQYELRLDFEQAWKEWEDALAPLSEQRRSVYEVVGSIEEQEQCFRESAALAGYGPEHPAFQDERDAFEFLRNMDMQDAEA